ncbi:MAG: hypothetical protein FWH55_02065 [Oscillospiraceae bacterium]|nr:hypothetical protein [Oscillospiraceae bacterium]
MSKDTVARYLRVHQLNIRLKSWLDNGSVAFIAAVTLSFLKEDEQALVADCIERNSLTADIKKADLLRQYSDRGKLDGESVYKILSGETAPKPNRTPTVKVDKAEYARCFKPSQSAKEVQSIVEKALELYFDNQ